MECFQSGANVSNCNKLQTPKWCNCLPHSLHVIMRKKATTVHSHPRHSSILPALPVPKFLFNSELKSSLYLPNGRLPMSPNPGAIITLGLNYINYSQDENAASKHQKNGRIRAPGNNNVPVLHGCTMVHIIDLITYYFLLQMLYLYLVHMVFVKFSPTKCEASAQTSHSVQFTNNLLLPQNSHGIPIRPKY